jgi:hypothetical protein
MGRAGTRQRTVELSILGSMATLMTKDSVAHRPGSDSLSLQWVVFQDSGWWVAQCLEHDLCAAGRNPEELARRVVMQIRTQFLGDLAEDRPPFSRLRPAPERYWQRSAENERFAADVPWGRESVKLLELLEDEIPISSSFVVAR